MAATLGRGRFWNAYGPSEGRRWLERALAGCSTSPLPVRAKALNEAGWIASFQGDHRQAVALLGEGRALFEELEDKPGIATSLFYLGFRAVHGRDRERTRALGREAEALLRELEDRRGKALLLLFLGMAAVEEGDGERAVALFEESLALNLELGDLWSTGFCLNHLGFAALQQGSHERAAELFEKGSRVFRRLRDKQGIFYCLLGMAGVAALRQRPVRAARLWGAAEGLREAIGAPLSPFVRFCLYDYEGYQAAAHSLLDEAAFAAARAEGRTMTLEQAVEYALKTEEQEPPPKEDKANLSERELEILRLVAQGMTDPQVASRLYLSPRTVGQHLRSIYRKLGVPTRAAAAREAVERSLI